MQSRTKKPPHFVGSAHSIILHARLQEESLAQPTMLLAFCAEGFALSEQTACSTLGIGSSQRLTSCLLTARKVMLRTLQISSGVFIVWCPERNVKMVLSDFR